MLDRIPRVAWILAVLGILALGAALGTNALIAKALSVDPEKLAAVRQARPAAPSTPDATDPPDRTADSQATQPRSRASQPRTLEYYRNPILSRSLFDSSGVPTSSTASTPTPGEDVQKSELDALLVATAEASDPMYSTALIAVNSAAPEPYRIGDSLLEAKVIDIQSPWLDASGAHHAARVIILRDGEREYIDAGGRPKPGARRKAKDDSSDKPKRKRSGRHTWDGITDLGGGRYSVEQSEIDYALSNLDKLAREARVVPHFQDGATNGFKVFSIRRNSALRKMGLKNNDVLTTVNGFDLSNTERALEIFSKLQSDKSFSLEILRNGEPMTLEYTVQ